MHSRIAHRFIVILILSLLPLIAAPIVWNENSPNKPIEPNATIVSYEQNNTFIIKLNAGDKYFIQIVSGAYNWDVGEKIIFKKEGDPSIVAATGSRRSKVIVWD